jgi:deazaflavin-dependent oxidoreductase (nitroreductase family)
MTGKARTALGALDDERAESAEIGNAHAMISLAEGDPAAALAAVQEVLDGTAPVIGRLRIVEAHLLAGLAPANPDWYYNLAAAGEASVERGTETYKVTVRELTGAERDRIYAEQARRYPGFAEYERQTAGVRTIPVLELRRA